MINDIQLIIDVGHGGIDSGAVAVNKTLEKELNLIYSNLIVKKLNNYFSNVLMTRDSDITLDLTSRAKWVAEKASLFNGKTICLSCHFNAFNGTARGTETIYSIHSQPELATVIASKISELGIPLRRVFNRKSDKGNYDYYAMHRLTGKAQTIIIEPLFMDNIEDFKLLESANFMDKLSDKIVDGVLEYLGIPKITVNENTQQSTLDSKKLYEELKIKSKAFADNQNIKYQTLLNEKNKLEKEYQKLFTEKKQIEIELGKIKMSWGCALQLFIEKLFKNKNKNK